ARFPASVIFSDLISSSSVPLDDCSSHTQQPTPGIVAASSPRTSGTRPTTPQTSPTMANPPVFEEHSTWTSLKTHILNPTPEMMLTVPQVTCVTCTRKIAVLGVDRYDTDSENPPVEGNVLVCGHLLCADCIQEIHSKAVAVPGALPLCPYCRHALCFAVCGCPIKTPPIPHGTLQAGTVRLAFGAVPLTNPEVAPGGRGEPVVCRACFPVLRDRVVPRVVEVAREKTALVSVDAMPGSWPEDVVMEWAMREAPYFRALLFADENVFRDGVFDEVQAAEYGVKCMEYVFAEVRDHGEFERAVRGEFAPGVLRGWSAWEGCVASANPAVRGCDEPFKTWFNVEVEPMQMMLAVAVRQDEYTGAIYTVVRIVPDHNSRYYDGGESPAQEDADRRFPFGPRPTLDEEDSIPFPVAPRDAPQYLTPPDIHGRIWEWYPLAAPAPLPVLNQGGPQPEEEPEFLSEITVPTSSPN
ncbi:hypothetical protein QBC34DRAFT_462518, partial [Podospora aff. communis PSN243]